MRFVCTQVNLLTGLGQVSPLAGRNPQLPVLQHILTEVRDGVLHLTCTDLEVGARVAVGGKAEKDGSCTVTARQFLEYIQQLPTDNPITLEVIKKQLHVTTKGFSAQFPIAEADDFPLLPTPPQTQVAVINGQLFCQALSQTSFAAARDEARPEIHSILVVGESDEIRLAATDSFRLAEQVIPLRSKKNFSFLLPVSSAQEVSRLFATTEKLTLLKEENYVVFQGEGVYLSSRLIDGSYPDYRQIIPTKFVAQGEVKRDELLRALKILNVFLPRESRRVILAVHPENSTLALRVEGSAAGQGAVTIDFEGQGKELTVLFNIHYLIDGVAHSRGDTLELDFGGDSDPVVLRPQREAVQHQYIVMPIQA